MAVDFRVKSYFTPTGFTPGFPNPAIADWYEPFQLAYLNLTNESVDTYPQTYQYVPGKDYTDHSIVQAPLPYIEITKTMTQGDYAQVVVETVSDRDFFEIKDNEGILENPIRYGHMMPRIGFPYRAWNIDLKAKGDGDWHTPPLFTGMLTRVQPQILSDKKISGQQDGIFRYTLEFQSWDAWQLRNDNGAAIWHHRANATADKYHLNFKNDMAISFDDAITRIVAWMNQGKPTSDFPISYSYTPKAASPYNLLLNAIAPASDAEASTIVDTRINSTWDILTALLNYMGAVEGLGLKYVPTCSNAGVIDVIYGGFDKTHAVDEDFRSTQGMQKNTSTDMTIRFNMISVPFSVANDAEYWIKFTLYKSDGAGGWDTVLTIPSSGYEYVPYDATNTHSRKYYNFPTQEITPENTYKWDTELVTAGSFTVALVGASAFSPPTYNLHPSNSEVDYTKLRTFVVTRGRCDEIGYANCPDGNGGYCLDSDGPFGCYPDPMAASALTGTVTFTNGLTAVTGAGTAFTTELVAGQSIKLNADNVWHVVSSITNDGALTLTAAYSSAGGAGASSKGEVRNAKYGIIGKDALKYANVSNLTAWNTKCRLNSKRMYECSLNTDSSIREPISFKLVFNDGHTTNLIGSYLEFYEPTVDDMVVGRCTQQTHTLQKGRVQTIMEGFRI